MLLIHYAPKSYNLLILTQVVPTIAPWLGRLDRQSFTALPLSSKVAGADSPLALNQQIERYLRNIRSNATIPLGRHACIVNRAMLRVMSARMVPNITPHGIVARIGDL